MTPNEPQIVRAPCNDCARDTDHDVLKVHKTAGDDRESETSWSTTFEMIECRGCHFISLKRSFWFSEYEDLQVEYFPPPLSRRKPGWWDKFLMNVPVGLDLPELFDEVYSALHADSRRLAAMGARAILDVVIVHCIGDVGTFRQKLEAFEKQGFINSRQREFLDAALDAGSAASHRGHRPTPEQLDQVMDIVEHVVQQVFALPQPTVELRKSIPHRQHQATTPDSTTSAGSSASGGGARK